MKQKLLVIVGPTGSGKTACAVLAAQKYKGEVIAADSRTVYRGMDIGTAKPKNGCMQLQEHVALHPPRRASFADSLQGVGVPGFATCSIDALAEHGSQDSGFLFAKEKGREVEGVVHWGFDLADPDEDYTVSQFQEYAQKKIEEIAARGCLPILVGGTGLFVDAVVDNLQFPEVAPDMNLRHNLESRSTEDLFAEFRRLDPVGAEEIDRNNPRRLVRAIEVCRLTGRPFSEQRTKGPELYEATWIGLRPDEVELGRRIDERVDLMIADGLVDEVRGLRERYGCGVHSMSAIGYKEICEFFSGNVSLADAIANIKRHTRHFAKRQMTWFKRNERVHWFTSSADVLQFLQQANFAKVPDRRGPRSPSLGCQ